MCTAVWPDLPGLAKNGQMLDLPEPGPKSATLLLLTHMKTKIVKMVFDKSK